MNKSTVSEFINKYYTVTAQSIRKSCGSHSLKVDEFKKLGIRRVIISEPSKKGLLIEFWATDELAATISNELGIEQGENTRSHGTWKQIKSLNEVEYLLFQVLNICKSYLSNQLASMPLNHQELAQKVAEFVPANTKEVVARQSYVRITYKASLSIYIWPRKDKRILVDIEGSKALKEFKEYAEAHWGLVHWIQTNKSDGKALHFWLLDEDFFYSTINSVLSQSLGDIDLKSFISDINEIELKSLTSYEKKALSKQRIGHSQFATKVKQNARFCCEVNTTYKKNLIASHIKPWSESVDEEKVDINNGICLSPNFDGLFENGLISFNSDGRILVRSLSKDEISAYGLTGDEKIVVTDKKRIYLQWHHENKFLATAK